MYQSIVVGTDGSEKDLAVMRRAVELALTDAVQLGMDIPVRMSGDIKGTPGGYVMGPKGMLEMKDGIIRAARHVHMSPSDAKFYNVKHLDRITLKVTSKDCNTRFDDLIVRVDPSFKLEEIGRAHV